MSDCHLQTVHRNGVLRADVDVTLVCAYRIAGNGHCFEYCVGIAFQNRTVHECAGIAFVGIARNVLDFANCVVSKLPFTSGGETCAAATAKSALTDSVDYFLRLHFRQNLDECLVTVVSDVLIDVFGVDYAAVAKSDTGLLFVKVGVGKGTNGISRGIVLVQQSFDDTSLDKVFGNDLVDVFQMYVGIKRSLGVDNNDRTYRTQTETTRLHYLNVVFQSCFGNFFLKIFDNFRAAVAVTAGTAAN